MAFSLACDAGKTTLRIEGTDSNVTWNDVANAGAGSVAVDGGGTEDPSFFVTEYVADGVYQILKKVQFGDGTNALTFYSKNEAVYFDDDQTLTIKANATLQLGEISSDYCINGAYWSWEQYGDIIGASESGAACKIYGSTIYYRYDTDDSVTQFNDGTVDFRNSIFISKNATQSGFQFSNQVDTVILKNLYISNWRAWNTAKTPDTAENVWMHHTQYGFGFFADANMEDLRITDEITAKIRVTADNKTVNLINPQWTPVQADIAIYQPNSAVYAKYTCDIHVVDKDGSNLEGVTVVCEDKDSNQVFSVQTGADGKIAQQTITYKKWEGTDETETEYSLHKFTFSRNGYTLLVMENVTVDAQINWDIEVRFPERIRARMANLGRLAILR